MMNTEPDKPVIGLEDETAFEESLVYDTDFCTEKTEIIDATAAPSETESAPPAPPPSWIGKKLGHFKLLRLIGEGVMGRVIQALDVNLQRIVALKVLRKRIPGIDEQERVNQFLREARAAAQIEHPNVVRIHEINQVNGWWYIAMEMVDGDNLKSVIKATGSLPPQRVCPLIADAATALAVAHDLGILHRDVKPGNLMIHRNGRCKLTDFGLVRIEDPNDPFDFTNKSVGTPHFMAPEVIQRKKQTSAIDIYSLGATLYYALTGSPPFRGKTLKEVFKKHLEMPPPDVCEQVPECSASLAELIQRMMAKNPASRPSATDLAAALRAESIGMFSDDSGILTPGGSGISTLIGTQAESSGIMADSTRLEQTTILKPESKIGRLSRSRWFWVGSAVTCLAVAGIVVAFFWLRHLPKDITKQFQDAPASYGVLPPNTVPKPVPADPKPPAFSWVGKKDPTGFQFVASKQGLHFYPIDDPTAALIRWEDFVGYRTAADAQADGKSPIRQTP
jgi:eukaryotic-like serine/threonine-protein kinase